MVLYAEHSFNASTFTARVITSTLADLHSAVTGAIGALKGPLHGGANEAVQATFEEIGTADRAEAWLEDALANKTKIMGFGHRVYKHGDSRVPTMRAVLGDLAEHYGRPEVLDLYDALETAMAAAQEHQAEPRLPGRPGLPPDRVRHEHLHAAVRGRPHHGLDRARHGAARRELADPAAVRVRGAGAARGSLTSTQDARSKVPGDTPRIHGRASYYAPGKDWHPA